MLLLVMMTTFSLSIPKYPGTHMHIWSKRYCPTYQLSGHLATVKRSLDSVLHLFSINLLISTGASAYLGPRGSRRHLLSDLEFGRQADDHFGQPRLATEAEGASRQAHGELKFADAAPIIPRIRIFILLGLLLGETRWESRRAGCDSNGWLDGRV